MSWWPNLMGVRSHPSAPSLLLVLLEPVALGSGHDLAGSVRVAHGVLVEPPNVDLLRPLRLLRGYRKRQKMIASRRLILLIRDPFALYVRQGATSPIALRGYFTNIRVFDKARCSENCIWTTSRSISRTSPRQRSSQKLTTPTKTT